MTEALFSLVAGEGDGAILGLAAGDTAGGAWELGYSAVTEVVTLIAYQLIADGHVDQARLARELLELDGAMDEEPVFRSESPELRAWLDRAHTGAPSPDDTPSLGPASRSAPLGVAYRRDPEELIAEVVNLNRMFNSDASSVLGGITVASAVAASCFGQVGRDLLTGVAEAIGPAVEAITSGALGLTDVDAVEGFDDRIKSLLSGFGGVKRANEALEHVVGDGEAGPLELTLCCLLLAAPAVEKTHEPVAECAKLGGSNLAAAAGAIMGARVGIRAWPWAFANDTWFAEIGRRLVRGPKEARDLPIPYAVEQHLISGVRQDHQ